MSFPGRRFLFPDGVTLVQWTLAFFYGSFLGLSPSLVNLLCLVALVSLCFIRVPLIYMVLSAALCWLGAWLVFDPWIDALGLFLLKDESLQPLWISLANAPVVPWTQFANSMVMGALVLSLALLPVAVILAVLIRRHVTEEGRG